MIRTESASLIYQDQGREVFACHELNLEVGSGEFLGILGPSGSGKSSLLYLLSGLKIPTHGEVFYEGKSLKNIKDEDRSRIRLREFGFLFQQPYLLGYLTALENVLLALPNGKSSPSREAKGGGSVSTANTGGGQKTPQRPSTPTPSSLRQQAIELLQDLGLGEKTHRRPHELSGGERQRVCVARALLGEPKVIFADEPTASLDHKNGLHVVELLNEHRGQGSLVMVTHDPTMLEQADRVLEIAEGKVVST